jgi:hypothetical protein
MTTEQYLKSLRKLSLTPHGVATRKALGLSARQLARLAAGASVTETLKLLILSQSENKRLRAALEQIAAIPPQFGIGHWIDIAKAALNKGERHVKIRNLRP